MLKIEDVEEENDDNSFEDSSSEFESSPSSSRHRKQERMVLQEQKTRLERDVKAMILRSWTQKNSLLQIKILTSILKPSLRIMDVNGNFTKHMKVISSDGQHDYRHE